MTLPGASHRTLGRGLTATLRGFYYAVAAIGLAATFAVFNESRAFEEWSNNGGGTATAPLARAEEARMAIEGFLVVASMAIIVLTIMWWYRATRAIEQTDTTGRYWTSGWAIGGWFIPFANLVIPKLVLNQIDRVSGAAEEGTNQWKERRVLPIVHGWWTFWILAVVLRGVGASLTAAQRLPGVTLDPAVYTSGLRFEIAGMGATCVAALFAAASLRVLGDRLAR